MSKLYHGTSLAKFDEMRDDGFVAYASGVRLSAAGAEAVESYANERAEQDVSYPVTISLDEETLRRTGHLMPDPSNPSDMIYTGAFGQAIVNATAYDFTRDDDVSLPLDRKEALPLPLEAPKDESTLSM